MLGLLLGVASLALGPLGLIEAIVVLGIVLSLMLRMPSCDVGRSAQGECYAPVTGPATIVYGIAGLAGAALVALALRRSLFRV